jgi:hypothetical protein
MSTLTNYWRQQNIVFKCGNRNIEHKTQNEDKQNKTKYTT